jgi:hypothetical protein
VVRGVYRGRWASGGFGQTPECLSLEGRFDAEAIHHSRAGETADHREDMNRADGGLFRHHCHLETHSLLRSIVSASLTGLNLALAQRLRLFS